jgi:hypothetical protein
MIPYDYEKHLSHVFVNFLNVKGGRKEGGE